MLRTLMQLRGQLDIWTILFLLVSYAIVIFVALPVHELAHAFAAYKLGDTTAKWQGRLRFSPLAHLDPIGTLMIVLVGVGYARPVPVNPNNFRNPKRDMALTALAGPVSNLLMAFAAVGLFRVVCLLIDNVLILNFAYIILIGGFASINLGLAVFNLLPIPPLDGSRLWWFILPSRWIYTMERYSRYITLAIFLLVFTGAFDIPLQFLRRLLGYLICLPFGFPNFFS